MGRIYLGCAALGAASEPYTDENEITAYFGREYADSLAERSGNGRKMSVLGAALLISMLKYANITPGEDTRIIRNENGKPCFPELPRLCFSISHSGGTAVCALSESGNVGVDIEYTDLPESDRSAKRRQSIAARWLSPRGFDCADTPEGFLFGWTAFEAASKYSGGVLADCRAFPDGTVLDRFVLKEKNRTGVLTLCRNNESTVEILPSVTALGFVPASPRPRKTVTILGVDFDNITLKNAVSRAGEALDAESGNVMTVFTPNPVISMYCLKNPDFYRIINSASLSLADGWGVVNAAKRKNDQLAERVTGIDFGHGILSAAAERHKCVFLLGGKPGIAKKAALRLRDEIPGLDICGARDGYGETEDEDALAASLLAAKPCLLIVCLGSPRQERWIHEHLSLLRAAGVRVAAALGGAVDVWSGKTRRAPDIFIRLHIEWLWRCLCQPRRLKNLPLLVRYRMLTPEKRH